MRTQQVLDDLQALVERSGRIPGFGRKAVDERRFHSLLGQLREALPTDMREAARVTQEKERIIAEASARAEEMRSEAQQEAEGLVSESEIIRQARADAEEILRRSEAQAQDIRKEAHTYATEVLDKIDGMVSRIAAAVEAGRAALAETADTGQ